MACYRGHAHLIVYTHAYVRLLFEGGYYFFRRTPSAATNRGRPLFEEIQYLGTELLCIVHAIICFTLTMTAGVALETCWQFIVTCMWKLVGVFAVFFSDIQLGQRMDYIHNEHLTISPVP